MLDRSEQEKKNFQAKMRAWIPDWWPGKHAAQQKRRKDLLQELNDILEQEGKELDVGHVRDLLDSPAWSFIRAATAGRLNEQLKALMNAGSTDGQMRYAQGAVDSLRWVLGSPETIMQYIGNEKYRQISAEERENKLA